MPVSGAHATNGFPPLGVEGRPLAGHSARALNSGYVGAPGGARRPVPSIFALHETSGLRTWTPEGRIGSVTPYSTGVGWLGMAVAADVTASAIALGTHGGRAEQ